MGSSSSKFRRHLENGDEHSALQIFESCSELRKSLDPNCFYGESVNQCTPVHLAAKHAMKPLLRILLREMQGDPTILSGRGETALHCASRGGGQSERRAACLLLLIQWRGYEGELVDLDAQDHGFSATAQCQGHCFKARREHRPGLSYCNQKVVLIANSSCDFRRLEQTRLILHRCLIASFLSLLAGTRYFLGSKKFNIILWKKLWQKGLTLTK